MVMLLPIVVLVIALLVKQLAAVEVPLRHVITNLEQDAIIPMEALTAAAASNLLVSFALNVPAVHIYAVL
jgi:hypothetical protein